MKNKRNLTQFFLLVALLWPAAVRADFTYTTANGQVTITGYSGTVPSVLEIPDTINSLPVVRIGGQVAFSYNYMLTNVTIPKSLTSLADATFFACINLKGVYFEGNAPNLESPYVFGSHDQVGGDLQAFVVYLAGSLGWGATYSGLPTFMHYPPVNGGFDDTGDFHGWTVSGNGTTNITGPNVYSGPYAAVFTETASHGIGLGFVLGSSNVLTQAISTQAGKNYALSFAVNGMANGFCSASWNGNTLVNQNFNPGWTNLQFVVTATSASTVLQFTFPPQFGSQAKTAIDSVTLIPLPTLTIQPLPGKQLSLTVTGFPNAKYALERTTSLNQPVNWSPQLTNSTDANGIYVYSTTSNPAANYFWRIRYVP